jgi:hypothetical protein
VSVQGGNSGGAAPAAPAKPGPVNATSGSVTAAQVYQEVLNQGGSATQAQGAAALVSGIESNGELNDKNPTSTASGLFQFLTTTWASNGGSQYAQTAGAANLQQQVDVFLKASAGNNFYPWAPDLGGSYNGSGSLTTPLPGSKVANFIAVNTSNFSSWAAGSDTAAAPAASTGSAGASPTPTATTVGSVSNPGNLPSVAESTVIDGITYVTPAADVASNSQQSLGQQTSALAQINATLASCSAHGPC